MIEVMLDKWDIRFMDLAKLVSSWSKDPSTRVGAAIIDPYNRVVSVGYNGFPRGVSDHPSRLEERGFKYAATIHAEENALLFANRSLDGCRIYVTRPPCGNCAAKIIQSGIRTVYTFDPPEEFKERWGDSMEVTSSLFEDAGVRVAWL